MSQTQIDYYQTLGVSRDADGTTIKSAYRKLAMKWHPDRNPGDAEAEARFKAVGEAYECLKDPQKRAAYDRYGHDAFTQGMSGGGGGFGGGYGGQEGFADIGEIFETIFGSAFGGARGPRTQARRGADLRYDMQVTLEEAFHGKSTEIEIEVSQSCETCDGSGATPGTGERQCNLCGGMGAVRAKQGLFVVERPCPTCAGRGAVIEDPCNDCLGEGRVDRPQALKVDIPPGVDTGTRIRLSGKGEAGQRGASPGDLYIFIHVKPHDLFEREGTTLATRVPISFTTAALGGCVEIPDLDGSTNTIDIPAGMQSGKQLRVRGAGMPVLQGRGRGDLVVEIMVETPTRLTRRQKEILEEFRGTETGDECPESRSFLSKLKDAFGG
ncbi:molecular chaperone DnaJ [Erythrobacter litoralis]|jgi:molecular chaperone DnaJ|uniref:Chaperone protein DnaJ n=1 Tax=Erythrobacter litoralis TaxID=39960 RepID=A0A074MVC9_9SPHN|nr:molecular chaperone DnaJ [Erythrobacter litoralis]AOL23541.1 molecular chaperone DnaJ [Erythrobacter litoralis]KEO98976.1 molecular chaperone DnaJ [Erythrobacter litoralis]MEE4337985.1 molecular chaperone DnaJ [Erythrobacter sp.]